MRSKNNEHPIQPGSEDTDPFVSVENQIHQAEQRLAGHQSPAPPDGDAAELLARASDSALVRRLKWLLEIDRAMGSTHEPEQLLAYILDRAVELTGAERGFIVLQDQDGRLHFQVAHDQRGRNIDNPANEISSAVLEEVSRTSKPVIVQDAVTDDRFVDRSASIMALELKSILSVPLLAKDGLLGAIYLDHRSATSRFTRDDLDTLEIFSRQAGVAFHNAQLYMEIESARQRLQKETEVLRSEVSGRYTPFQGIVGHCEGMREVFGLVRKVADSQTNVLILGENGTGKELIARAIHYTSIRSAKPCITVNCAALPETLLESELFGIEKGTATGVDRKTGKFEQAHGGTLFLDEIGDMSLMTQSKVLRAIQDRCFQRLGGTRTLQLELKLIAATNKDLGEAVREGQFREDLYYRLNVIPITLPPLRERKGDIELLINHFLKHFSDKLKRPVPEIHPEAGKKLLHYRWPGNVRQLENTMERLALLVDGDLINVSDLPFEIRSGEDAFGSRNGSPVSAHGKILTIREMASQHALAVLKEVSGNKKEACRLLGISFKTLQSYLRHDSAESRDAH